jgi:hypothetical protein
MLAGVGCFDSGLHMQATWRADGDHVDFRIGQHVGQLVIRLAVVGGGEPIGRFGKGVDASH